jgi:hypothetical protein
MNLDTLIREANPAFLSEQPDAESPLGRAIEARIAGTPPRAKRRTVVALAGLTAVAAVAVLVIALLPGSLDGTIPAAAAVLREAATAAADQPPVKLGPGRYLYSKTSSLSYLGEIALTNPVYADPVYLDYKTDSRFWIASNGSAVMVIHNVGPVRFTTQESRANWVAAGSPPKALSTRVVPPQLMVALPVSEGVPPFDVSKLPTNPPALVDRLKALENSFNVPSLLEIDGVSILEWFPNPGFTCFAAIGGPMNVNCASPENDPVLVPSGSTAATFQMAVALLGTPETGMTPALRSALYRVIASLHGVELLGSQTDRSGRKGIGIASPVYAGLCMEVILDPTTGNLLQVEHVVVDPAKEPATVRTYFGATVGQALMWTDYLSSGVVDSMPAMPTRSSK